MLNAKIGLRPINLWKVAIEHNGIGRAERLGGKVGQVNSVRW